MNAKKTPPSGTPCEYMYIRTKAERYLALGPDAYRKEDAFNMPPAAWGKALLKKVESGMRQIVDWRGLNARTPLTGLEIDGFYALIRVFHFETSMQAMMNRDTSGFILDRMTMRHAVTGDEVSLYNLVKAN